MINDAPLESAGEGSFMKSDVMKPSSSLLCKLGSLYVHADEMMSDKGHQFDISAIKGLLADPELKEWIKEMDKLALLPKKR